MRFKYPTALAGRLMPRDPDWWAFYLPRLAGRTANDNHSAPAQQGEA